MPQATSAPRNDKDWTITAALNLPNQRRTLDCRLALGWLLATSLVGCASYNIGNRTLYRSDVYSVYVPIFESDSFRRHLGERLSEAVAKEIELKTPYKVIHGDRADSVLTGRILRDEKFVVAENANDEPRDIELEMKLEVEWRDRRGELIAQPVAMRMPGELVGLAQAVHLVPEGGQSVATAQQEAIQRLAEQIVATMEVPW